MNKFVLIFFVTLNFNMLYSCKPHNLSAITSDIHKRGENAENAESPFRDTLISFRFAVTALNRAIGYTDTFADHVYYIYWDELGQSNGWRGQAIRSVLSDMRSELNTASSSIMDVSWEIYHSYVRLKANEAETAEKYKGYLTTIDTLYNSMQSLLSTLWSLDSASYAIDKDIYDDIDLTEVGEDFKSVPDDLRESYKGLVESLTALNSKVTKIAL